MAEDGRVVSETTPKEQDFVPGPETARLFRDALGRFATGVTVVTTQGPGGPVGITANSFAALSLDPPLVLWSPARASRRFAPFAGATHFAIHILGEDQREMCAHFTRPDHDFSAYDTVLSPDGVPLIEGCIARFDCQREVAHEAGDHLLIVGRVLRASHGEGAPLIFSQGRYGSFRPEG